MNKRTLELGLLAGLAAIAAPTQAQVSDFFICDDKNDQIFRFVDLDGDGMFLALNEAVIFVDQNGQDVDLNNAGFHIGPNGPIAYWNNTKNQDGIYRAEDSNGNGVIDGSEIALFYNPGDIDSEGLAITADGAVWFSSDFSPTQGIWRCQDLNADGDALDAGEAVRLIDAGSSGSNPPFTVETDAGTATISTKDFWRMAPDGNGVIVYEGFFSDAIDSEEAIFRFEDKNLDGDITDAGEARLFLNYHNKDVPNNDLPMNPDFGTVLRSWELNTQGTGGGSNYGRMNQLATRQEGGKTAYYLSTDTSSTNTTFNTNIAGLGINGLIYRAVDVNSDGDVNDAGEVKLYYDGSFTGPFAGSGNNEFDKIVGIKGGSDALFAADLTNGGRFGSLKDLNGDGDAMDQQVDIGGGVLVDEMQLCLWDYTAWGFNPPFPMGMFPGPFIKDVAVIDAGAFAVPTPPSAMFVASGIGCSQYGAVPVMTGTGDAHLGTSDFKAILSNVPGGAAAVLFVGASSQFWLGFALPLDLGFIGLPGCNLYQSADFTLGAPLTTGTPAANAVDGQSVVPVPVPNNPAFVGFTAPMQFLVVNPHTFPLPLLALTGLGEITAEL